MPARIECRQTSEQGEIQHQGRSCDARTTRGLPILQMRLDHEEGLAEAIEKGEQSKAKQEGVLSQRSLALIIFPPCQCDVRHLTPTI
jgi:hypothetical protein